MQYIVKVEVVKDYYLNLTFDNGVSGQVDITELIPFKGIFEPLKDYHYFKTVCINPDIGTICWDNGADLSPSLLYDKILEKD